LGSETEGEGDAFATDAALDRQLKLNVSLTNPSELDVKLSRPTTTSLEPEKPPRVKNLLLSTPARQKRTSASASTTAKNEAKRQRSLSTKLASCTNGSRVRTRSRPSSTRIFTGANRKPTLQMTCRYPPPTSSKQKQSATLALASTVEEDDDPQYEAVEVLAEEFRQEKKRELRLYYLIKWVGDWDDTWEPVENVGSDLIAEYRQKKHRETQVMNLDTAASRGTNYDPMHIDVNTNSGGNRTRDGLLDNNDGSDEDSLFVDQRPSSRGNGIGRAERKEVESTLCGEVINDDQTTEAQSVDGV
jgi:hypothetical protein